VLAWVEGGASLTNNDLSGEDVLVYIISSRPSAAKSRGVRAIEIDWKRVKKCSMKIWVEENKVILKGRGRTGILLHSQPFSC
jgi:hypothetical protein